MDPCQTYISTRCSSLTFTFQEALLAGYAPNGGLFIPSLIPKLSRDILADWSTKSFKEIVFEICKIFVSPSEIPVGDLKDLINNSFRDFRLPEIVQIKQTKSCAVLELFHGPTYAFKDLAMGCTMSFLDYFLAERNGHLNVLVSTSGDTGAAALHAAQNAKHVSVTVLYPLGRVSEVQELQMTTIAARSKTLQLFGLNGTSDDGDDVMRALYADLDFASKVNLSNVNSINWSRVLIQIAHWFYGYFRLCTDVDDVIEIVCPTGAGGNLAAGCIAQKMGLPIKIVACTNSNDIAYQCIERGMFSPGEVSLTLASAMDIQIPYNVERVIHLLVGQEATAEIASAIDAKSQVNLQFTWHKQLRSVKVDDEEIIATMQRCFNEERYLICPHTATAMAYAYQASKCDPSRRLILSTASPIKFAEALDQAGLFNPELEVYVQGLKQLPQKVVKCYDRSCWIDLIRENLH